MSSLPPDDAKLTDFLRQHRPSAPSAALDLESKILAQVQSVPHAAGRDRSRVWRMPLVLAASLLTAVLGYRLVQTLTAAELTGLEAVLESDWNSTVSDSSESSLSAFNDFSTHDFTVNN